jgi:ActR/RegA family two-component response regulator
LSPAVTPRQALACLDRADTHRGDLQRSLTSLVLTPEQVRWHYIHLVYETHHRNVSETARQLGMHRRTLQRILGKTKPRRRASHV